MGIQKVKPFRILFLASLMMAASPFAWAQTAPVADQDYLAIPLPDIEFDGSVLQQLPRPGAGQNAPALAPVRLVPPDLTRSAVPPATRMTLIAPEVPPQAPVAVQPVTVERVIAPAPAKTAEPAVKPQPQSQAEPQQAGLTPSAPMPKRKPGRADPVMAETQPPAPAAEKPGIALEIPKQTQKETPPKTAAAPLRELPPEPQIMPMVETAVTSENSGAVFFAVTSKEKVKGGLNPSAVPTASAPVVADQKTAQALSAAMAQKPAKTALQIERGEWWQDNPEIILSAVPYPKPRPAKGMASESFVKEARKNLVETYTIIKRDGDAMPAMARAPVTNEKLPPARLSVADIPHDPLASQLVDMSPEDVARALNAMAPASGRDQAHLARELTAVAKPRIVRQQGEWIRKSKNADQQEEEAAAAPLKELVSLPEKPVRAPLPPSGPVMLVYKGGEVDLSGDAAALIEKNVLENLALDPESRVRIMAYAAAEDGKEATSRRISLARALAVRSFLIGRGIDATRLDVRAMGLVPDRATTADKVDIILVPGAENGKKG